ncbi:spore germination protein GerPB [Fictibacillus sp. Mic-4]|uniref:spore germination protein GerPB n=1 Tax=Fictibacillus TaxID=1329200 RepID=UPI00040ECBA9|nr:spore germination protein GerPB [Fictibacillus gelatini]
MNLFVNQSIVIHQLRVDGVSNSSVFQIGSSGMIRAVANLANTGGFTAPAPQVGQPLISLPIGVGAGAGSGAAGAGAGAVSGAAGVGAGAGGAGAGARQE